MKPRLLDCLDLPPRRPADEYLQNIVAGSSVLQDFAPLTQGLEWELSELSWATEGVRHFSSGRVPFVINNNGRCSEAAARVLFASLLDERPEGMIEVIELGAGSGLFARHFVKSFADLCEAEGRDWFERLVYVATDRSRRTVEQWRELGIFAEFEPRVRIATCDATRPESAITLDDDEWRPTSLRCVIANYVLDVLPSSIVRRGRDGPEELVVRTHLTPSRELLQAYTRLSPDDIRAAAASDDWKTRTSLLPLLPTFELEAAFRPVDERAIPHLNDALSQVAASAPAVVNHGAFQAIARWLERLAPGGFMLINDYGPATHEQASAITIPQRFGPTAALGINFPLLDAWVQQANLRMTVPSGDEERAIHTRLLTKEPLQNAARAFTQHFAREVEAWFDGPSAEAGKLAAAGRNSEALDAFKTALSRSPRDWQLIGRAAEFVGLQLREHQAGLELARSALEINPWFSPWLWNVLGDCLFALDRRELAHEAYLEAQKIDPADVRTHFNLSFTHLEHGEPDEALLAIARALAADTAGLFRDRLLTKQSQIVDAVIGKWTSEQQRLAKRDVTLRAAVTAGSPPLQQSAGCEARTESTFSNSSPPPRTLP